MRNDTLDMLNGPILKRMVEFSIPLIFSNVLQLLFNTADLVIVGNFAGSECLAAVSATGSITALLTSLFIGISTGVNVLIAKYIGENNKEKISLALHTSLLFGAILSTIVAIIGYFITDWCLVFTDCPANIFDLSSIYLKIIFMGMPAQLIFNYGVSALRANGETKKPLDYLIVSGIINVVLNIMFILIFNMDVDGVALATIISQYLSALFLMILLYRRDDDFNFSFSKLTIDKDILIELLRLGIPAGIQSCVFSISNLVLQIQYNSFGSDAVAAIGGAHTLESYTNAIVVAITTAGMTYVSQNYGAKNYERIKKSIISMVVIELACGLLFIVFGLTCDKLFMSIFTDSKDIIEIGCQKIQVSMFTYWIYGLCQSGSSAMRGLNYSHTPSIINLLGICGVRILYIYTIFKADPTLFNVMVTYPISWAVTALIVWPLLFVFLRNKKKELALS